LVICTPFHIHGISNQLLLYSHVSLCVCLGVTIIKEEGKSSPAVPTRSVLSLADISVPGTGAETAQFMQAAWSATDTGDQAIKVPLPTILEDYRFHFIF
jgi:hypothetical protein